jgi:DSF synthase
MSLAASSFDIHIGQYEQLSTRYEVEAQCLWYAMHAEPRPCFNPTLLSEIAAFQQEVGELVRRKQLPISYLVLCSNVPGVFNLGGDLNLFQHHIEQRDRAGLAAYAKACIDVLYANAVHLDLPITTISLVQGSALGGGFEAALSSSVLIVERGTELGLPEILFNLFPGMGAYSLLARKLDMRRAEELITAGRLFSAEELHELGVVDVLAEPGEGEKAVRQFIKQHRRSRNGLQAIARVREYLNPVTYEELMDIANIWVEAALNLTARDLRMMGKLVGAQNKLQQKAEEPPVLKLALV